MFLENPYLSPGNEKALAEIVQRHQESGIHYGDRPRAGGTGQLYSADTGWRSILSKRCQNSLSKPVHAGLREPRA
jgi:hypothetical protein